MDTKCLINIHMLCVCARRFIRINSVAFFNVAVVVVEGTSHSQTKKNKKNNRFTRAKSINFCHTGILIHFRTKHWQCRWEWWRRRRRRERARVWARIESYGKESNAIIYGFVFVTAQDLYKWLHRSDRQRAKFVYSFSLSHSLSLSRIHENQILPNEMTKKGENIKEIISSLIVKSVRFRFPLCCVWRLFFKPDKRSWPTRAGCHSLR